MNEVIETADLWTEKVNAKDVPAVLGSSNTNIELVGPGGASAGHETLAQWVESSEVHLKTLTRYAKGGSVVFEQEGTWENQNGHVMVYTFMEIKDGKVVRIARFDSLDEAFGFSGLSERDKVE